MKVIFLCGSFEEGCDGVGDYTRRLAVEMLRRCNTNEITVIALKDPYVSEVLHDKEYIGGSGLSVLRLPSTYSQSTRFRFAKKLIDEINPGLISLQFVIYSFHPKGLPWGLEKEFKTLLRGRPVHIMFHEIWIGFTKISPLKHKIVGFFQRKIILGIIRRLQPKVVTTTNRLYQLILEKNKVSSQILPLFSNILMAPVNHLFRAEVLNKLALDNNDLDQWIFAGIFGNLYPQAKLENSINEQLQYFRSQQKKIAFIGFGKVDSRGLKEFERLEKAFFGDIKFLHLGEQSAENISNLLQMLTTGFSCTPTQHIGKSGVFAAMKLHGVDVIFTTLEKIPEYDYEIKMYHEEFIKRPEYMWDVSYTSEQFSKLLNPLQSVNNYN